MSSYGLNGTGGPSSLTKVKRKSTGTAAMVARTSGAAATPSRRRVDDGERELTEEQRMEIKEAFELFDSDKDGAIDCGSWRSPTSIGLGHKC